MWNRLTTGTEGARPSNSRNASTKDRRAYYRVEGLLPVRVTQLQADDVAAAIFDLSIPDPLLQPIEEVDADSPMAARLRRIEEKLDLLLGALPGERPRPLAGRDRKPVVFSGSGLRLDVDFEFRLGDAFGVEILLPPPYLQTLRAVGFAVNAGAGRAGPSRPLAIGLRHMEDEERDALVAYSYDLQRFALRHRSEAR